MVAGGGEERERKEKEYRDANLPSRPEGGNYVLMRSRLAKSPGKRDTRPDLRTRSVPSSPSSYLTLSLSLSLSQQPPAIRFSFARVRALAYPAAFCTRAA